MVEDLDPVEEVMSGKQRKAWKPYGDDLGIPALDNLFVMESGSAGDSSDEEGEGDEHEHSESGRMKQLCQQEQVMSKWKW